MILHRTFNIINEKFNIMEGRISGLDKKIDQQQVTLLRLEQHVIKNNKLLFGNYETDNNIKELSVTLNKPECNDNKQAIIAENDVASQQEKASKTDDFIHTKNSDKAEEPAEIRDQYEEVRSPVQEETARISLPYFNIEQINQFHVDLKQTISEISKLKESIEETVTTRKTPVDVTSGQMSKEENVQVPPTCFSSEQIKQMNGELKIFMTKMIEIEKLLKETIATKVNPVFEIVSPVRKQENVQISLSYLSTEQISKLNGELKQVTEKYQSTNVIPVVELIRGPALDHPVMSALTNGVLLRPKKDHYVGRMNLKFGLHGLRRSIIQNLLAEDPYLDVYAVVEEVLRSRNEWKDVISNYELANLQRTVF